MHPGGYLPSRPPSLCAVTGTERGRDAVVPLPGFLPGSRFFPASLHIPFVRGAGGNIWLYLRFFAFICKYLHSVAIIGKQEQNGSRTVLCRMEEGGRAGRRRQGRIHSYSPPSSSPILLRLPYAGRAAQQRWCSTGGRKGRKWAGLRSTIIADYRTAKTCKNP